MSSCSCGTIKRRCGRRRRDAEPTDDPGSHGRRDRHDSKLLSNAKGGNGPVNYPESRCPIWPGYPASIEWLDDVVRQVDSQRAGGMYRISRVAILRLNELDDPARARLTTRLIDHTQRTGEPLEVDQEVLFAAESASRLHDADRAKRLLEYLRQHSSVPGKELQLFGEHLAGALAWSESITPDELAWLCGGLVAEGRVRRTVQPADRGFSVVVTDQGHRRSNDAFVAMWLDKSMNEVFNLGIRPGIEDAGYRAIRIDHQPDVDKIDDDILENIRRCCFIVADFTHGQDGVRGSVYFEAGFARGLEIDVIHTCRADQIGELHFDTRQYHHIRWNMDDLDKLRRQLAERIRARIRPGPGQL